MIRTIMNKIDKDFVYNRFPKTEHDIQLYEWYKEYLAITYKSENKKELTELLPFFPVYEGTENVDGLPILTRFGFMALCIDDDFMNNCFKPWCRVMLQQDLTEIGDSTKYKLIRACMIEFALLGCHEAHQVMNKLDIQIIDLIIEA